MAYDNLHTRPAELLQALIRFDTTNPPGHEAACITYLRNLLAEAGIPSEVFALDPERPSLVARLRGSGDAPPLLLYGHVDVVTTVNQTWQHPPFGAEIHDGMIWGRGALDMKGGVAMLVAAFLRAKAENTPLPGDVILAIVPDEEAGGSQGAGFMVAQHPEQFSGVRYALGEFGGFTLALGGRTFYPIMVAEKQICQTRVTVRGQGGHGSMPVRGGAMARLSRLLRRLDQQRLPTHITPTVHDMLTIMADAVGGATGLVLRQLLNPRLTETALGAMGERGRVFEPLTRNTVSPTIIAASDKINVIPSTITVDLDGRLLPGQTPDDMLRELRAVLGSEAELDVVAFEPGPARVDMGFFDVLGGVLKAADPTGIPVPLLLSGVTDGRFFSRLGIQTYGFTPMKLPPEFAFTRAIHAADERIPVEAVGFGADALFAAIQKPRAG